jgi:hypothetical protein
MTTDRDRSIERLLRRARSTDATAPAGDCPDAETLAALADDTLPAAARREVEAHVADCHRCQALSAAVARAEAPVGAAAGDIPAWRRRALNWLVPAAAAATAVALWVLVPGQRTPLPEATREEQQTAATSLPRSSEVPPTSQPVAEEPLRVPADSPTGAAAGERDANARQSAAAESAARSDMAQTGNAAALQGRAVGQANPAATAPEERLAQVTAPAAPPPAAAPAPPPPAAGLARRLEAAASVELVSPNPQIRWRIGPGARVQYSADGGATWTTQQTGASTELTAGSAPTAEVCWLVGRGGLVLRTTDAGRQWQRVPFPETIDLTAITASSTRNASVVLADGRRFATDDAGDTWTLTR